MLKNCTVSFTDLDGITHSVSVTAETLYEAVVLAAGIFKRSTWAREVGKGMTLTVTVQEPSVSHSVPFGRVLKWLETQGTTPKEVSKKGRLRVVLDGR